ncbi:MAG: V-type sodium ATPase catalytic subunit A [Planctomycetes bacterium ADurb.Bin401]|nr:MAG: V-type sodium ATPase catalytic subunit A [Planctomycetes bacterium ADurb.Bin401]
MTSAFKDKDKGQKMMQLTQEAMSLLEQEAGLAEIVRLVGSDAISPADRMVLQTSKSIREDYLHQNAFHEVDTYASMEKQYEMLNNILYFHQKGLDAIQNGADTENIFKLTVRNDIAQSKFVPEEQIDKIIGIRNTINEQFKAQFTGAQNA